MSKNNTFNLKQLIKHYLPIRFQCFLKRHLIYRVGFTRSLSQARQDLWLMEEVFPGRRNGFFVEIGSADGVVLSNTYLLEKRLGWQGICVEANPLLFRELRYNRKNVEKINICVDEILGEVVFVNNGLLGGIYSRDTDNNCRFNDETTTIVKTIPLVDILERYNAPNIIDYLSIDVEGAETRILKSFPFFRYTFLSMSIERPSDALQQILFQNGYQLVKIIPFLDYLYIHKSYIKQYADNLASYSGAFFSPATTEG